MSSGQFSNATTTACAHITASKCILYECDINQYYTNDNRLLLMS